VRLLLDEQVPRVFADELPGHDVSTAQQMGWSGIENGDLLTAAAEAGFDALITLDRGFEFQQNPATLPIAVVVVEARSNRIEALQPLAGAVLDALETVEPKTLVRVGP